MRECQCEWSISMIVSRHRYLFKQTMKSRLARTRPSNDKSVASTHSHLNEQKQLDAEYLQLREVIMNTPFYLTTTRHHRIRLNLWSQKLDRILTDLPQKRNRNNYIKLMYLMAQSDVLVQPFATLPPEGDLPSLRNYQINAIVDLVESKVNEKIAKYGYCRHCQQQEKERSIPFRLSTARIHTEEEYSYIDSLAYCSHPCQHPLTRTAPNDQLFMNSESKSTLGFAQSRENQQLGYIMCEQDEKENQRGNKLKQTTKEPKRQKPRTSLQGRAQINIPHHIRRLTKQSEDSSDAQADLDQSVLIPSIRAFNPLTHHRF